MEKTTAIIVIGSISSVFFAWKINVITPCYNIIKTIPINFVRSIYISGFPYHVIAF